MKLTTKLSLASMMTLTLVGAAQAQSPRQGDYYAPGQNAPQQLSPGQEQRLQQGDYVAPSRTMPQQMSPGQEQRTREGDFYKPNGRQ